MSPLPTATRGDTMSDEQNPEVGAPIEEDQPTAADLQAALGTPEQLPEETPPADLPPTEAMPLVEPGEPEASVPETEGVSAQVLPDAPQGESYPAAPTQVGEQGAPVDPEHQLIAPHEDLPSAAAAPADAEAPSDAQSVYPAAAYPATTPLGPAHDGEIRISADHPMAGLYVQTPAPPVLKGNRGAGVLIALLATVAFAVLYAAMIAIWNARVYPPSTFLSEGLLPWITSWGFIAGVAAFFVGLVLLVVIFGRAGWWAYVIFSFFIGVLVWAATLGTFALTGTPWLSLGDLSQYPIYDGMTKMQVTREIINTIMFTLPVLGAAILAREVAVWFGAWIGARGQKVKRKNAVTLAEYEQQLSGTPTA